MSIVQRTALFAALLAIIFSLSACNENSNGSNQRNEIPMPTSAKQVSDNVIEIPFPYIKILSNGVDERWFIARINSPDNLFLSIMYNHGGVGTNIPLKSPYKGTQNLNKVIKLSGKPENLMK